MAILNLPAIRDIVKNSTVIDRSFIEIQKERFDLAKLALIQQFEESLITQEIAGGIDAENISGTLNGYGNLYTFIGFPNGTDPISPLRDILNNLLILKNPTKQNTTKGYEYIFPVSIPIPEIIAASPMPFESGNSWVEGIENGISGFSNFIYRASKVSRSGKGIEIKNAINAGNFQPTPYLLNFLSTFSDKITQQNFLVQSSA